MEPQKKRRIIEIILVITIAIVIGSIYHFYYVNYIQKNASNYMEAYNKKVAQINDAKSNAITPSLLVTFKKGITPEMAKEIVKRYGGEIKEHVSLEQSYQDGKLVTKESISPWNHWNVDASNFTSVNFTGADENRLSELTTELEADKDIGWVMSNDRKSWYQPQ